MVYYHSNERRKILKGNSTEPALRRRARLRPQRFQQSDLKLFTVIPNYSLMIIQVVV